MIGDGWDGEWGADIGGGGELHTPAAAGKRRVAVVTGTRAEFGLLKPVALAIAAHEGLELALVASGSHLVSPAETLREIKKVFAIADAVPMQIAGKTGRAEDVQSLGRGVARFGRSFERLRPDWVLVLGDRIEAFAAAAAASVGGYAVAHVHGGDRAEGVADEAMRHAITKLAHVHFAASASSAERIVKMGEPASRVMNVGSPAIDALAGMPAVDDATWEALGSPTCLYLMHPIGRSDEQEEAGAAAVLAALVESGEKVLALMPNLDPGREGIARAVEGARGVEVRKHLEREVFVGVLKRLQGSGGVLVGNSSAGMIEAAAVGLRVIDIGPRQSGRERCWNVVHVDRESGDAVVAGVRAARSVLDNGGGHPFGDGRSGARIAAALGALNPHEPGLLRKRNAY